jgi:hypothetical protein
MVFQTLTAPLTMSVIVGVRIPTPFRHPLRRTGVGTSSWDLDWYREWQVGYRGKDLGGEDREAEEEM